MTRRTRRLALVGVVAVTSFAPAPLGAVPVDPLPPEIGLSGGELSVPAALPAGASRFVPLPPRRLIDTRRAEVGPLGKVAAGGEVLVDMTSIADRPAGQLIAAAVNITATDAAGIGYVTAWPADRGGPEVSNLNLSGPGATVPNFAIVPLDALGRFRLSPSIDSHLIVDVAGLFVATPLPTADGRLTAITPTRVLDTRSGVGATGRVAAGGSIDVRIAGANGVAADAAAVVITLTATNAVAAGYVSAWPAGAPRPDVSNLNVPATNSTVANLAIVPLGAGGAISLFAEAGADLLVDVVGWMSASTATASSAGLLVPAGPDRQLDTRQPGSGGALLGGYRRDVALRTPAGVNAGEIAAVAANLTVAETTAPLYLTAYPARTIRPETSNLNADRAGQTIATFGVVPVGAGPAVSLRPFARTHAIVDVAGFFLGSPTPSDPLAAPSGPSPQGSPPIADFDRVITGFLAANGYSGASVAVAVDDRVVYAQAYGTSNIATGERMRAEHHFRIASQSKMLTGVTVARLIEQGVLSADRRVWPLLNGSVPVPPSADPRLGSITIGNLLTHESGFPASPDPFFDDGGAFGPLGPPSCEAAAQWMAGQRLESSPGTKYRYANINFCLLGLVIEAATGRDWSEVVNEQVLGPSGVVDMYLGRTYVRRPLDVAHVTPGPLDSGGGYFMESIGAAGAWMGTPTDIVRVVSSIDELVSPEMLGLMRERRASDPDGSALWYGRGLVNYRVGEAYGHTGALQGSRTMAVHEANGVSWAIMVNARFPDHAEVLLALMTQALATTPRESWPTYDISRDLP